jgi:hypothetical protein
MPELFLHLDLRHLPPAWPTLPVLQKGQIRARPPFLGSILAFRLAFGLRSAACCVALCEREKSAWSPSLSIARTSAKRRISLVQRPRPAFQRISC